mmetsp:Transcript_1895/g.3980  ORF Transcript_1895/g.3980 Transcript_1895/m.3980 type:complete len:136 (+) Transcript_1895:4390-4797(+)
MKIFPSFNSSSLTSWLSSSQPAVSFYFLLTVLRAVTDFSVGQKRGCRKRATFLGRTSVFKCGERGEGGESVCVSICSSVSRKERKRKEKTACMQGFEEAHARASCSSLTPPHDLFGPFNCARITSNFFGNERVAT